jgi:hypothetical protein
MMGDTLQNIIVGLIVAAAVLASARAVVRAVRNKKSALTACASCKLKDVCNNPEKFSAKKCSDKVAQVKKQQ